MKEINLIVDEYMPDKVLEKIKEIVDIEIFVDSRILIETNDKLQDDITFKNVLISITCVIKDKMIKFSINILRRSISW